MRENSAVCSFFPNTIEGLCFLKCFNGRHLPDCFRVFCRFLLYVPKTQRKFVRPTWIACASFVVHRPPQGIITFDMGMGLICRVNSQSSPALRAGLIGFPLKNWAEFVQQCGSARFCVTPPPNQPLSLGSQHSGERLRVGWGRRHGSCERGLYEGPSHLLHEIELVRHLGRALVVQGVARLQLPIVAAAL